MITKIREAMQKRRNDIERGDGGFTLIELLVVMIIIGILAAIAIPIFQNQQKGARDSATTSDVRNVATNIQSMLVKYPDADMFAIVDNTGTNNTVNPGPQEGTRATDVNGDGILNIWVGDQATGVASMTTVSVSKGTALTADSTSAGQFYVLGQNPNGKSYKDNSSALQYDSALGGIQD